MFTKHICIAMLAVGVSSTAVGQTVHLSESFESYADTTALNVDYPASQPNTWSLETAAGEGAEGSSKWIRQNNSTAASITIDLPVPIPANSTEQINLSYYIRSANFSNSRTGISIRDNGLSTVLFSIGTYNAATHNAADPGNKWVARLSGYPGTGVTTNNNYYTLVNAPNRPIKPAEEPAVWTKLEVHGTASAVTFEVNDVESTGDALPATGTPTLAINKMRFGYGATPNQVVDFDSVNVWSGADSNVADWDLY